MSNSLIVKPAAQCLMVLLRERDKQQHFLACFVLALLFYTASTNLALTLSMTMLVGLGKEIWDRFYGSGFCWRDMAANLLGACCGMLVTQLTAIMS